MSCFRQIYKGEIKKIFQKKAVWIMLAVGILLMSFVELNDVIFSKPWTLGVSQGTVTQRQVMQMEKEACQAMDGQAMDDTFIGSLREKLEAALPKPGDLPDDYEEIYYYASQKIGYRPIVKLLYNRFQDERASSTFDFTAQDFVDVNQQNLDNLMVMAQLNDEEKAYWQAHYDRVEKPYTYYYTEGLEQYCNFACINLWMVFILIVVSLAGIFSDETQFRTDALLMSSKNGRAPLGLAKLAAGISVAVGEMLLVQGFQLALLAAVFGGSGWNAPVQLIHTSAINITMGQLVLWIFAASLLLAALFGAFTMLLSRLIANPLPVMAIQTAVLLVGMLSPDIANRTLSMLWAVRPTYLIYTNTILSEYRLFHMGNALVTCLTLGVILYAVIIPPLLAGTVLLHQKAQFKSR